MNRIREIWVYLAFFAMPFLTALGMLATGIEFSGLTGWLALAAIIASPMVAAHVASWTPLVGLAPVIYASMPRGIAGRNNGFRIQLDPDKIGAGPWFEVHEREHVKWTWRLGFIGEVILDAISEDFRIWFEKVAYRAGRKAGRPLADSARAMAANPAYDITEAEAERMLR